MKKRKKSHDSAIGESVAPGTGNVFEDLGFSKAEAAELKVKAELSLQILQRIKALGLTQVKAAAQLHVSQPDISKLMNGRHAGYSVDRLLSLLNALEVDIDIVVRPKHHGRKTRHGVVRVMKVA
jgi:predicted XRE-type DNA-binding protein